MAKTLKQLQDEASDALDAFTAQAKKANDVWKTWADSARAFEHHKDRGRILAALKDDTDDERGKALALLETYEAAKDAVAKAPPEKAKAS